jgi:hypothetical protein
MLDAVDCSSAAFSLSAAAAEARAAEAAPSSGVVKPLDTDLGAEETLFALARFAAEEEEPDRFIAIAPAFA